MDRRESNNSPYKQSTPWRSSSADRSQQRPWTSRYDNHGSPRGRGGRPFHNPRSGHNNSRSTTEVHPTGYKKLESMVQNDTPKEIVLQLSTGRSGLKELLSEKEKEIGPGMVQMLLQAFGKMSLTDSPTQSKTQILNLVLEHKFERKIYEFLHSVTRQRANPGNNANMHVQNALRLLLDLSSFLPNTSEKQVSMTLVMIESIVPQLGYDDQIMELLKEVKSLNKRSVERKMTKAKVRSEYDDMHLKPPPDDFRDIPVFPEMCDVHGKRETFIRTNLTNGKAYQSLEHYLDVQFRLLREDFVRPLREGIEQLIIAGNGIPRGSSIQNIKVYKDVQIQFAKPSRNGIVHQIHFNTDKMQHIRWQNTKRLLYGNLLCFSSDYFKENLLFATVADRSYQDLEMGLLTVEFVYDHGGDNESHIDMYKNYTMVETEAYFEAYRHVLAGLKETEVLPLSRYIVLCTNDMYAPEYLRPRRHGKIYYDLSCIGNVKAKQVDVLDQNAWPASNELELDHSQSEALKLALTNELALIQGPPGTGKTHVGLIIMKTLLANKDKWNRQQTNAMERALFLRELAPTPKTHNCPILVICYTNHALDQFLEGIVQFKNKNHKIVRVGGRCANEMLKQFTLVELRKNNRQAGMKEVKDKVRRKTIWEIHDDMRRVEESIKRNTAKMEASTKCVMKFSSLVGVMSYHQRAQLQNCASECKTDPILFWLELEEYGVNYTAEFSRLDPWTLDHLLQIGYPEKLIAEAVREQGPGNIHQMRYWIEMKVRYEQDKFDEQRPQISNVSSSDEKDFDDLKEEAELVQEGRMIDLDDMFELRKHQHLKHNEVEMIMRDMSAITFQDIQDQSNERENENEWQTPKEEKKKKKRRIKHELGKTDIMTDMEADLIYDVFRLELKDRWKLYRTWVRKWQMNQHQSDENFAAYNKLTKQVQELRREEDKEVLQSADVVAVTTTGAAKYRDMIFNLKAKIVIVEEAAEVLEAHIITAMPKSTQHLILIGDHQQLKPSPTVYQLAKNYHLDTSLFERLISEIPHQTLTLQHRMRPSIADLLRPHIYKNLHDHDSVLNRESITGMQKSLFFLSHTRMEESLNDGRSKKNEYEAEFLIHLCKYILMQGYKPEQVTILTTYTGQLFAFRQLMKQHMCRGVRVTAVDNFQGEENDIILLSLVRSNEEGKIGFLSVENRICVALSRARNALYCIGNMQLLSEKSAMWRKIIHYLKENVDGIGEELILQCKNHPGRTTPVKVAEDFSKVPEGGCGQPCNARLDCGHTCRFPCHPLDHSEYKCMKKCNKTLCEDGHMCSKKCHQDCGPCTEPVEKVIPKCNHIQKVPCFQNPEQFSCKRNCEKILPCQHKCTSLCGQDCTLFCDTVIQANLPCGHTGYVKCYQTKKLKLSMCIEKCPFPLECGHYCKGSCYRCMQGRLHVPCKSKCGRTLVCGHACKSPCSENCPPCEEKCTIACEHNMCMRKCGEPCIMCRESCKWQCEHFECTMMCSEPCNRPACNKPCKKKLQCGHMCIGLCGEDCPDLCKICDEEKVTETFFGDEDEEDARFVQLKDCKHIFTYKSLDHWVEQRLTNNDVKMIECPRCKTPILRNKRYGNAINELLRSVNAVKVKIRGETKQIKDIQRKLEREFWLDRKLCKSFPRDMEYFKEQMAKKGVVHTLNSLSVMEHQFQHLQVLAELQESRKKVFNFVQRYKWSEMVKQDLDQMYRWVMLPRKHIHPHEAASFQMEIRRISDCIRFTDINKKSKDIIDHQMMRFQGQRIKQILEALADLLFCDFKLYDETKKEKVEEKFKLLTEQAPELNSGLGITHAEKEMICKAMGFAAKGHWYKCPKGHIYCIGECGGATVTSKCPECRSEIGGSGHRLLDSNALAPEMDGARHSAFDPNNMYIPPEALI